MKTKSLIKVKRCPICRTRMARQEDGTWICPNCGEIVMA
jgi:predicted RNA-binding Zn-ribbon protein involved in translation (DUF1610 family)